MNDLFPLYLKAALLVAFALALTVGVTALAWRSNVYFVRRFRAWLSDLPARLRARRDPAFRRERERAAHDVGSFAEYEAMTGMLQIARTKRRHSGRILEKHGGLAAPQTAVVAHRHEADLEEHVGRRMIVAAYFAGLSDDKIVSIARGVNERVYGGRVPHADLEAFFREERERIGEADHFADTHFARLIGRFAAYAGQAPGPRPE